MSEVRFVPEDRGLLDAMYHAMTVCQTLHPDPNDSLSDGILKNTLTCLFLDYLKITIVEGDFEETEEGEYCLDGPDGGYEGEEGISIRWCLQLSLY